MSLLSRLFGTKPTKTDSNNKTPNAKSSEPISSLSVTELIDIIQSQKYDTDTRAEAINHMPFDDNLVTLLGDDDKKLSTGSAKRLAVLLDEEKITYDELHQKIGAFDKQIVVLGYSKNDQHLDTLIAQTENQEDLVNLATKGRTSKIRQTAAQKIHDQSQLEDIARFAKSKDKNVYKIVKNKLDEYRRNEQKQNDALHQLKDLYDAIVKLQHSIDHATIESRLNQLHGQWLEASKHVTENPYVEQYEQAAQACKEVVRQYNENNLKAKNHDAEKQAKEQPTPPETVTAEITATDTHHKAIEDGFTLRLSEVTLLLLADDFERDSVLEILNEIKRDHLELSEDESIPNVVIEKLAKKMSTAESALNDIIENGTLADRLNQFNEKQDIESLDQLKKVVAYQKLIEEQNKPELIRTAQSSIDEFNTKQKAAQEEQDSLIKQTYGLMRSAQGAANDGNLRRAFGIRKAMSEKLESISHTPKKLQEKLEELDLAIEKLQDYRTFATEPKKHELIASMRALTERVEQPEQSTSIDPEDLADQIQKLQRDWKELVYGGKDTQPELWEEFHALSQRAYVPCKAHFSAKSEQRKENLHHRQALVSQLETYLTQYDWENAVWKDVEHVIRTAHQEWRSHSPVNRSENAPVQKQFDQAIASIQAYVDTEYTKNKNKKTQLAENAEKLVDIEDIEQAIEQTKQLQNQWKKAGRTWQKDENRLWKTFRGHCDAVFQRKQSITDAFKEELNENKNKAETLISQIESLSEISELSILEKRDSVSELSDEFKSLDPLPKNATHTLNRKLDSAVSAFEAQVKRLTLKQQQETWLTLFEFKSHINAWHNALLNGLSGEQELAHAQTLIEKADQIPASCKSVVAQLLEEKPSEDTRTDNIEKLRLICIQLEVVCDVASPTADKSLRMEYQVKRLEQGMKEFSGVSKDKQIEDTHILWLKAPVVDNSNYQQLKARYISVLETSQK